MKQIFLFAIAVIFGFQGFAQSSCTPATILATNSLDYPDQSLTSTDLGVAQSFTTSFKIGATQTILINITEPGLRLDVDLDFLLDTLVFDSASVVVVGFEAVDSASIFPIVSSSISTAFIAADQADSTYVPAEGVFAGCFDGTFTFDTAGTFAVAASPQYRGRAVINTLDVAIDEGTPDELILTADSLGALLNGLSPTIPVFGEGDTLDFSTLQIIESLLPIVGSLLGDLPPLPSFTRVPGNVAYFKVDFGTARTNDLANALNFNAYPNPTAGTVNLSYQLQEAGFVHVGVLNMAGQEVATLVDADQQAGAYTVRQNIELPAGLYTIQVFTEQGTFGSKLVVR